MLRDHFLTRERDVYNGLYGFTCNTAHVMHIAANLENNCHLSLYSSQLVKRIAIKSILLAFLKADRKQTRSGI